MLSGIDNEAKKLYGLQFHPEVDLTKKGTEMFKNFLFNVIIIIITLYW